MAPGVMQGSSDDVAETGIVGQVPPKAAGTTSNIDCSPAGGEISNSSSTPTTSQIPTITTTHATEFEARAPKQHRAPGKKINVTGRPAPFGTKSSSLASLGNQSQASSLRFESYNDSEDGQSNGTSRASNTAEFPPYTPSTTTTDDTFRSHQSLWTQVFHWVQQERAKLKDLIDVSTSQLDSKEDTKQQYNQQTERALALDQLERILSQNPISVGSSKESTRGRRKTSTSRSRNSTMRALRRGSTSDSDYADMDRPAPSADVVLDNSKTLLFTGGEADDDEAGNGSGVTPKEREYWLYFKSEILRLTHTLGFKGWRRIPLDAGGRIAVVRLSGALTNAVYVVSPPKNIHTSSTDSKGQVVHRKPPPKLLLRIYGPQVEHLIDREHELRVLRRLGKKNIGPSVLGTFKNGRFEEYYHAETLTPRDLRIPETSKQIAKRMRELHEAIELLDVERAGGPTVWNNWDKWVGRCEQVITWLDNEITADNDPKKAEKEPWRKRGYVCGVPWAQFRRTVDRFRKWLDDLCGGPEGVRKKLVFAHNDTQYGNLLRLEPSGESPLLLPANEHRQLIVIDFEYASANTRAFEFANHFSEWCYNYHDSDRSWACNPTWYPTIEEQDRFIRAYLKHRWAGEIRPPTIPSTSATPTPTYTSSPRIPPFNLDSHVPYTSLSQADPESRERDKQRDPALEAETSELRREIRLWRIANSAQWVAWGIVQAKVAGLEEALAVEEAADATDLTDSSDITPTRDSLESEETVQESSEADSEVNANADSPESNAQCQDSTEQVIQEFEADEAADEFDYLAYAQDRALFFWADILSLGLAQEDEFPEGMVKHIKKRMIGR